MRFYPRVFPVALAPVFAIMTHLFATRTILEF